MAPFIRSLCPSEDRQPVGGFMVAVGHFGRHAVYWRGHRCVETVL